MKILIDNYGMTLEPDPETEEWERLEEFREDTSYFVKGAHHDPQYKKGRWDGRVRLVERTRRTWTAPIGLLGESMLAFEGAEVVDCRSDFHSEPIDLEVDPAIIPNLRPYQRGAMKAALKDRGLRTGKGLLRLPTRSGKTVIASAIIASVGRRALFVVNSDMLLRQTVAFFRKVLKCPTHSPEELVAQYGGGTKETAWITVASVQGLTKNLDDPTVKNLLNTVDVAFFDEAHHLEAETWREAMQQCDARYKIGLSATIYLSKNGTAKGTIWLVAATGPVLYSITPSNLIRKGWLCTPEITIYDAPEPNVHVKTSSNWQTQYRDGIVRNDARNAAIATIAKDFVSDRLRVLVTASRIEHVDRITEALESEGLTVAAVIGKTKPDKRAELCDAVKNRTADVLVGTVFKEAVDLPFLEVVIVADGMSSKVLTMQRLRNLTPTDDNDKSLHEPLSEPCVVPVIDFADFCTPILARHTRERLKAYREHEAFIIKRGPK